MASYRRAAWNLCWWGCLLGFFQVAEAARIDVPMPSIQDLLNRASPVLNENPLGYVQAHDSTFQYQQRSYSAPIQQKVTIPTPAVKTAVKDAIKGGIKGGLKANAAGVAVNAAVAAAVAAAGWVIDEAGQPVKKVDQPAGDTSDPSTYVWKANGQRFSTAQDACEKVAETLANNQLGGSGAVVDKADFTFLNDTSIRCTWEAHPSWDKTYKMGDTFTANRDGTSCPANTTYSTTFGGCSGTGYRALTDADYGDLDPVIDNQSADFRARLLKESCEGSLSPARCYKALQDAASFLNSGPSSIQGPSTTSSTTSKNADGTTTTSTTTKDTKFGMQYDGTGATATPTTTTTTKDSKGNESSTVDKEDEDSSTGTAPKEDEKEAPSPCATNCDGPAYKDLYTKTDVTKEGVLDTYAAKVKALPIMSAVGNFFTVNGGGSCPVWSGTIDIGWGQSVTLSNDFACQPWFTALSPAFHAVLMLVAAWLAFRVSILD